MHYIARLWATARPEKKRNEMKERNKVKEKKPEIGWEELNERLMKVDFQRPEVRGKKQGRMSLLTKSQQL